MNFPYKCCQCGYCCLETTCPVAQDWYNIGPKDPCPALYWDGDYSAVCMLAIDPLVGPEMIGVGAGCCIKAQARDKNGQWHDFAALSPFIKKSLAQKRRRG